MNRITPFKKFRYPRRATSRVFIGLWVALCMAVSSMMVPLAASANPYLAKPGEAAVSLRVATCATSGGFVHLYTALENGLFDKYGIKPSHIFIRGSSISLASLSSDEIQFLYCAADATIPGLATGIDGKLIGAPLVGLPYVLLVRKDIMKMSDLKGKSLGVTRPGDLSFRLSRAMIKKFNLTEEEVKLRSIGGSQSERYQALVQDIIQGIVITPPLDVRGKRAGFNVVYNLNEMDLPFIYSSVHTNSKTLKEKPGVVQRFVAAMAEAIHFVEKNPEKAKAALSKTLRIQDSETLQSAYDAYAKQVINRRMVVPANAVAETVEIAREAGADIKRKPADLFDNTFVENLDKSGFLKEIWGGAVPGKK
ncbi:MAG: ABC transporter substrate-binding protein [Candidatus Tectomicrobia bacterium]|uniref:ABC transporter substrate-binding protein n=1 Tax=Tectimicrobiota bacterium TaxID=2528274 RepID=A0A932GR63_UNCTE|nr:ABC transporter substrate-binding protein [Candidatus Tectomicrobia bacterium]